MQGGPFNIHKPNQKVYLTTGIYGIRVLGCRYVKVNDFSMSLRRGNTNTIIKPKKTLWRTGSYEFKKIAIKIMVLDVEHSGNYTIEFENPKSLRVIRSHFILRWLFKKKFPYESLEIYIG